MRLNTLHVRLFRNLRSVDVELAPGLNLFVGENGAGKTSILEAAHLLGKGRSFRTHKLRNIICRGEKQLIVRASIQNDEGRSETLAISKSMQTGTELRVNGAPERALSSLASRLPLQLMLPDVSDLVFGPPAERRQFLDWGLFHVKQGYHSLLREYLRILKQRNAWLRTQQHARVVGFDPWGETLVQNALQLHIARNEYCSWLENDLDKTVNELGIALNLQVHYEPGWKVEGDGGNLAEILADNLERDVKSGSTLSGPHRADFVLRSEGYVASQHVSRGQGKVISSALNIAQAQILSNERSSKSAFLIDDLGAELDRQRSERLFDLLARLDCQILATALDKPDHLFDLIPESRMFHVKHGDIVAN